MKRAPRLWLEEYKCGCSFVGRWRELPGYCGKHGDEKRRRSPLPPDATIPTGPA